MGELNSIQDELIAEMGGDLADITFPFTGSRFVKAEPYDYKNPEAGSTFIYSGRGFFGLSWTQRDLDIFNIESNDMKCMVFQRSATDLPQIDDKINYSGIDYRVVDVNVIPADNGVVAQLRVYL